MAKKFVYQYGADTIMVTNSMTTAELFVNGEQQDNFTGFSTACVLNGKLKSGETIRATLGGTWSIKCKLFIDNTLITEGVHHQPPPKQAQPKQTPPVMPTNTTPSTHAVNVADELKKYGELLAQELITREEFDTMKADLLKK